MRKFHKINKVVDNTNGQEPIRDGEFLEVINDLISVVEVKLLHCTFDFEESFADEYRMDEMNMAKQKFRIKIGFPSLYVSNCFHTESPFYQFQTVTSQV